MGVVEGSIFEYRDLHFRIPRPIFGSGANFHGFYGRHLGFSVLSDGC